MHVSISDAAARLTALGDKVDRSTLSRYLAQHAEALPTRKDGKVKLVDWEALLTHRRENIRVAGPTGVDGPAAAPASSDMSPPRSALPRFPGTQADGAARKVNAEAEIKELALAELRRELVPRPEVDRAAREAVALMLAAFERAIDTSAATAALKYGWDERQVRLVLKTHCKDGQSVFHRELLTRLEGIGADGKTAPVEVGGED